MIVGSVQIDVLKNAKEENLANIERMIDKPVDLVVLPELFATGYYYDSKDEILQLAEEVPNGYTTKRLHEIARNKNCHLTGAIIEVDREKLFITAVLVGPDGFVGKQRKRHLTNHELKYFTLGESSEVFDVKGCKVGLVVCFEGWFPESCRELMVQGAQVICHTMLSGQQRTLDIMRVRAIENKVYFVIANSISTEDFGGELVTFRGDSRVIDFNGDILINASKEVGLFCVEIDEKATIIKNLEDCDDLVYEVQKHKY